MRQADPAKIIAARDAYEEAFATAKTDEERVAARHAYERAINKEVHGREVTTDELLGRKKG